MKLEHTFTLPVGPDAAFRVLRDIERIGSCVPGATVETIDGDELTGKIKVKVGSIQVTYRGSAAFVDVDEVNRSATIEARGKEARGPGTADATIRATLMDRGGGTTEVRVVTDLAVTGRPAQFGRDVMADVGDKLLDKFAGCLADELADGRSTEPADLGDGHGGEAGPEASAAPAAAATATAAAAAPDPTTAPAPAASTAARQPAQRRTDEPSDRLDVAGGPVAKRGGPVVVGLAILALVIWLIRRR